MPLTATIAPSRSAAAAAAMGSRPDRPATTVPSRETSVTRGPHAGQALGWAWKRRSRGFSYSARQAAHMAKPAMVVSGRS